MKKAIKIILPILLAIAIVLCMGWYLFVYDREFTRDVLLYSARYFDDQGNYNLAGWFYDLAYEQAGDNDAVAIELAQQHKSSGNYTKAESTLARAIEDGGGVELYIELSKIYAEQDKLLDCVQLLGSVTNPQIKAQLDAMRPLTPTVSPAPGFYNQYISVSVTGEGGTLLVSPKAEYPSVHDAPYQAPIALAAGENTIYALTVADNGLVSPLGIYGYTIGGIIEEVQFSDSAIEASIRQMLQVNDNKVIYTNDLWPIHTFTVPEGTQSYADLKYLPYLEELTLKNSVAGDLSVLASLSELRILSITNTPVSADTLSVIGALPLLERLTLSGCSLSTTSGLEKATGLNYLDLSNNTIRNITALSAMTRLQKAYLQDNALSALDSLSAITTLTHLNVSGNGLNSIVPISGLTRLQYLDVSRNQLPSLSALSQLTSLRECYAASNVLADASGLSNCTALEILDLGSNQLTDLSVLNNLKSIARLDISRNALTALPQFSKDSALIVINASHNQLESLDALSGMRYLNNVYMDYNEKLKSVEPLASCPRLIQVDVYGTAVTEVESLTKQSIIVNFDPTQNS